MAIYSYIYPSNMVIFHSYVYVYQRVTHIKSQGSGDVALSQLGLGWITATNFARHGAISGEPRMS